jgi:hypothetical protein
MKIKLITIFSLIIIFFLTTGMNNTEQTDWIITIKRTSINSKSVTGELFVNGNFICHTLELPWNSNKSFISSIPSGEYSAFLRYDKDDKWRLQLEDVPNRTGIQIHIGNYPSQIEGCVLIGNEVINKNNQLGAGTSGSAYKTLKKLFYGSSNPNSTPDVKIKVKIEYNLGRTKLIGPDGGFNNEYTKDGIWFDSTNNINVTEYKRDLKYIYIKGSGFFNAYYRYPLFGGQMESKLKKTDSWEKRDSNYKREN